jgi:hypothetical protein
MTDHRTEATRLGFWDEGLTRYRPDPHADIFERDGDLEGTTPADELDHQGGPDDCD